MPERFAFAGLHAAACAATSWQPELRRTGAAAVNGRDRTRLAYGVRAQAETVRALLEQHQLTCEVCCALCFPNVDGLPWFRHLEIEGVAVDGPRRVAKLAARAGIHTPEQVQQVVRLLADALPSA